MVSARGVGTALEDALGKAAKWLVGLSLLAATLILGAWWLLPGHADETAPRESAAAEPRTAPVLPDIPSAPATEQRLTEAAPLASAPPADVAPVAQTDAPSVITGRLVDASGRAIAGAVVRHVPTTWQCQKLELRFDPVAPPLDLERLAVTQSSSDGRFRLPVTDHVPDHDTPRNGGSVWTGSWEDVPTLLVLHPAFASRAARCTGWRGGEFDAGDIVLEAGLALSGRAVDERGLPLAGVSLAPPAMEQMDGVARKAEWRFVRPAVRALTGADGRFALQGCWPELHALEFRAAGRCMARRDVAGEAGQPLDLGDVVLAKGGVIAGVVVDGEGRTVPRAHLLARPSEAARSFGASGRDVAVEFGLRMGGTGGALVDVDADADEAGAFRFDSLDPASAPFHVYAGAPGFEPVRIEDVPLEGPALRVPLLPVASLVLGVVDAQTGAPLAEAQVSVERGKMTRRMGGPPLVVSAEASSLAAAGIAPPHVGVFLLAPASGSDNVATVSAPGHATLHVELPAVAGGERRTLTVQLPRATRLAGRVLDSQRQPIAEAQLSIAPPMTPDVERDAPEPPRTRSDAAGRFAFEGLSAGLWILRADAHGFVMQRTPPIELREGTPVEDFELILQPGGSIAGVVLAGDVPVPKAYVRALSVAQAEAIRAAERAGGGQLRLHDRPPRDDYVTMTDEQGRFRLDDLSPEDWELTGPPGVQAVAQVKAGETTEITLAQRSKPRVRGRVTDAKGPVAGAEIRSSSYLAALNAWMSSGSVDARADAEGIFELELNEPGRHRLGADLGKARSKPVDVDIGWDEVHWVDLTLPQAE
jgi:hypothetical protein